jgi:hypothetical protein
MQCTEKLLFGSTANCQTVMFSAVKYGPSHCQVKREIKLPFFFFFLCMCRSQQDFQVLTEKKGNDFVLICWIV